MQRNARFLILASIIPFKSLRYSHVAQTLSFSFKSREKKKTYTSESELKVKPIYLALT